MIGLDVTREIVLTPTILEYMCRINAKRGAFIKKITKFYFDFHWQWEHIVGCVINDPLAVAYFIDPSICEGFESFVQITGAVGCRFDEFLPERTECKSTDTGRYISFFRNDAFESTGSRT